MQLSSKLPSRYKLLSSLGEGGFGEVYKAYDAKLDKIIAIKILTHVTQASSSSLKNEFEVLSKLTHPHLIRVYEYGFILDDIPYYTMEYIDGQNLSAFLGREQNRYHIPRILDQVIQALSYLHEKGILHGDIKPDNILISKGSGDSIILKLLDFGLISSIQSARTLVSGTPRFIAPEVLSERGYSAASDLYSLGMSLIESLIGHPVPPAIELNDKYYQSTYKSLAHLLVSDGIENPSAMSSFLLSLIQKSPKDRPSSAKDAMKKLKVILDISSQVIREQLDNIFINRKGELDVINNFISRENNNERILLIEGPRGMGKKSLIRQAIAAAQPEGYFVIDLSGEERPRNTIEQIINGISANLTTEDRCRLLDRHKRILNAAKSIGDSDNPDMDKVRIACSNIIESLQIILNDHPALILIQNIEYYSDDFYSFLDQLQHELKFQRSDIYIIISRNTDIPSRNSLSAILKECSSHQYTRTIQVPPFGLGELGELQESLFGQKLFNRHQCNSILHDTDGIPFLIVNYIKQLIKNGAIRFDGGLWHIDNSTYETVPIPSSITDRIEHEYSNLTGNQKHILQLAAHWGGGITYDEFTALSDSDKNSFNEDIAQLEDRMLIDKSKHNSYYLLHSPYINYVLRKTSKARSKKFSIRIVDFLEQSGSTDYERLAKHAINAGMTEKAIQYGFQAADCLEKNLEYHKCYELLSGLKAHLLQINNEKEFMSILDRMAPIALSVGMAEEALAYLEQMREYTSDVAQKAYYSRAMANIYYSYLGNPQAAMTTLDSALKNGSEKLPPEIKAELIFESTMINKDNREELRKEAAALARDRDINLYSRIVSWLIISYINTGKYNDAKALEKELLNLVDRVHAPFRTDIYRGLYIAAFYTGDYDKAKHYIEQKIKIDNLLCCEISLIDDYNALAGIYYIQGDFYEQIVALKKALGKTQKYNTYDSSFYLSNLSLAYRSIANYRDAYEALEQSRKYHDSLQSKFAVEWALTKYVHLYALMGDKEMDSFRAYFDKTVSVAMSNNSNIIHGHAQLAKAIYYHQRLQLSYALRSANATLKLFRKANDRDDIVDSLRLLATILIEKGDPDNASESLTEALQIFDEIHCDYLKPQLLLAEGALARAQQNPDAESKLEEALKTSKKMFTREYTWQIQRELALYHKDRGELHKALQYYRDAIDMIKEITETIDGDELKASYLALPFRKRVFDEIKTLKRELH